MNWQDVAIGHSCRGLHFRTRNLTSPKARPCDIKGSRGTPLGKKYVVMSFGLKNAGAC